MSFANHNGMAHASLPRLRLENDSDTVEATQGHTSNHNSEEMSDNISNASTERPASIQRPSVLEDSRSSSKQLNMSGLGRIRSNITRQNSKDDLRPGSGTSSLMQQSNISSAHLGDLEAFPTTSLHSFSFAAQHDTIAARHNIVNRSLEYLRERLTAGQRSVSFYDDGDIDMGDVTPPPGKSKSKGLQLNLTHVNDHAFDGKHRPPQTAPSGVVSFDFDVASSNGSSANSGHATPDFMSGSRSTTTTSGTSNQSSNLLNPQRGRASSFSEKYPDLRAQLQSSLSCTNLPNLNPQYQTSPLQPLHATNRWGQQLSQAVFTTSTQQPWQIQSANDYAMMIFGMGKDAIRKKSLIDYIAEDRREWLTAKLNEVCNNNGLDGQVLLCGDVLPVIKRLGTGAASVWIKGRQNGMIWVIEEIEEGVCTISLDTQDANIVATYGDVDKVFDREINGLPLSDALGTLPRAADGLLDLDLITATQSFTLKSLSGDVPCTVEKDVFSTAEKHKLRVSFLPHVAGIIVISAETLEIISANPVSTNSLFGFRQTAGENIIKLIPHLQELLDTLRQQHGGEFHDGQIIPELAFRDAAKHISGGSHESALRGIESRHRDGGIVHIDIQMRVSSVAQNGKTTFAVSDREQQLYALWLSYEKGLTPKAQSEVVQTAVSKAAKIVATNVDSSPPSPVETKDASASVEVPVDTVPRQIKEYQILEEMGAGAYGQVKLARYGRKRQKIVLKYVTKSRILVDTWTRDRKLGTVPLEIHVLNHLKNHQHRNLVEMKDFFEDDVNYYIVMSAHIPGMDLFDYIELNTSMSEWECKCISLQVAKALNHLHSLDIVHRDIKDENVVLDRNGWVKLIDFGSANYCRNGPFDTFHGTLDYASPEALDGKPYNGKEQDVWACGILFYTLIYKENPFYNIDEIMDRDLRIPYIVSENSIDLIGKMLNRDLLDRVTMQDVLQHPWYSDCTAEIVQEKVKIDMPAR